MYRTTANELFLGLDLGTSSLKLVLVGADGGVAARGTEPYPTRSTSPKIAEQDPPQWLLALERGLSTVPVEFRRRIAAIGVDGHVPSLVAVSANGEPVAPCLTWQDSRAHEQADRLAARFGDSTPWVGTTLPWAPSQLPAKAAWLASDASVVARTRHLLQPKDFINHALTGVFATDAWSSKGLCHIGTLGAASAVLDEAGWSDEVLPDVLAPGTHLGDVTSKASERYGVPAGVPVAVGWSDAMASILGAGGFSRPVGVVLTGTSEIVGASASAAAPSDGLYLVPDTVAPLALSYGPTQSSGAAVNWIAGVLGLGVGQALDLAASASTDVPTFVPYLRGERAPIWDASARGLFLGLSEQHGAGELVRGVLDGVAMSARHVLEAARDAASDTIDVVEVGGRGIDHPAWLDARGSALGLPLRLHREPNLTALGAAMLAASAAGLADTDAMRGSVHSFEPTSEQIDRGRDRFARYLSASSIATEWSTR